ncbi:MAG: hypothetical protein ACOC93_03065, partial [Planctomycetota bacterium]
MDAWAKYVWRGAAALVVVGLFHASASAQATGPKLFFSSDDVAGLRERATREPYASMLEEVRALADGHPDDPYDPDVQNDAYTASYHARNHATVYLMTGNQAYAERAKRYTLQLINDESKWAVDRYRSLTRSMTAIGAGVSYDLCKDAWDADARQQVSAALQEMGDSLMRSGGSGYNYNNNWRAVRYSGAGLSYLASDETVAAGQITGAYDEVAGYLQHMHTTEPEARGWNPEGINYLQYPAGFWAPFNQAVNRWDADYDLLEATPGAPHTMWTQFVGTVPIRRMEGQAGWMPAFSDGHTNWHTDGAASLTFPNVDSRYLPGLKWQYDRLVGETGTGDGSWDTSRAGGLYGLLYYPEDVEAKNPRDTWGLNYVDPTMGMVMYRNRYRDEEDLAAWHRTKDVHPSGSHGGPDVNSLRIIGLNTQWVSGAGRYYTNLDPRGETTVFPGDPRNWTEMSVGEEGTLVDWETFADGSGWSVGTGSSVGTVGHTRRFVADYSGISGADALFVIGDMSENGQWWRLNTAEFNDVTLTEDGFVLTSPDGHKMYGEVLHGDESTLRTGTFTRHWEMDYEGAEYPDNEWIDLYSEDGDFLVVLTAMEDGAEPPTITDVGDGFEHVIMVGDQRIDLYGQEVQVHRTLIPGDADRDGEVGLADLAVLSANLDRDDDVTWEMGDFTRDGRISDADLA